MMLITTFAAGEVSKKLYGRIDLALYAQAVEKMQNWNILATGGIERRPGTKRMGELAGAARLIPFVVTSSTSFLFEIGPEYIRIWKNGEILKNNSTPVQFSSTASIPLYGSLAEIREIQYSQTYKDLYLVHKNYPPCRITWNGGTSFTLETLSFTGNTGEVPFQGPGNFPGCIAFFGGRLYLGSTTLEPQKIWASKPFEYTNFVQFDVVTTTSAVLKDPDLHVFTASCNKAWESLTDVSQDLSSLANPTAYYVSGDGIAVGTKVKSITATTIILTKPTTQSITDKTFTIQLWQNPSTTSAADYETKTITNNVTSADSAFYFEIASDKNDAIKWMSPQNDLIIGTESSEWVVPSTTTALAISAVLNSRNGSEMIQATMVGCSTLFFQQGGKIIKEYYYNSDSENYQATNLVAWADQMLSESPAVDFDYTNSPSIKVLVTRQDGIVCCLLYEKDMGVMGWSRIVVTNGSVISTATVPDDSGIDTIYFAVKSNGKYYLEALSDTGSVYLDSYTEMTTVDQTVIGAYKTDAVIYNATKRKSCPVDTVPEDFFTAGDVLYVGYTYESVVESLPVLRDGENAKKRIISLLVRFYESFLPILSTSDTHEESPVEVEPFSGVRSVTFPGNIGRDVFFKIRTSRPEPCRVLAIFANVE